MWFSQFKKYARLGIFFCIAILYFLYPNARPDFTKFNAHDSESYLALSQNLVNGLGYTRNMDGDNFIPHTLWPPGMPLLLIPAVIFSDKTINWSAVKYTMIIVALLGILLTWHYVYRITQSKRLSDALTLFLALNPFYWNFSRIAMAEVPSYVWIVGSLILIDIAWKKQDVKLNSAFLLGVFIGLGMMIKGIVIGLAVAPIGYMMYFKDVKKIKRNILILSIYVLGFAVTFVSWGVRNHNIDKENLGFDGVNQVQMLFKEVPEDPHSPYRDTSQLVQTAKENVVWYGIYHFSSQIVPLLWKADLKSQNYGAMIALVICLVLLAGFLPRSTSVLPLYCVILPIVLMMLLITIGGSERYWGPISLLCMLGIGIQLSSWFKNKWRDSNNQSLSYVLFFSVMVLVQVISLTLYIKTHEAEPYTKLENRDDLARLFEKNRGYCTEWTVDEISAVYTKNEHAFQLITGCNAPMVLLERNINPIFSHAVIDKQKLKKAIPSTNKISEEGEWMFTQLDFPMTRQDIHSIYYHQI